MLNTRPVGTSFHSSDLELVVEIWSPRNSRAERETKAAAYEEARVPYFWVVRENRAGSMSVTAYAIDDGRYVTECVAEPGSDTTITSAPVPVTLDPADLRP